MIQNLCELVQSGRYLELSARGMAQALASDSLKGFSEMELYGIARTWLNHDAPCRRASIYTLMRHIRFPLMTPGQLIQISQCEDEGDEEGGGAGLAAGKETLMRSDAACVSLLLEASNYQMMPFLQPTLQTERTRIRSDATHLLALGGVAPPARSLHDFLATSEMAQNMEMDPGRPRTASSERLDHLSPLPSDGPLDDPMEVFGWARPPRRPPWGHPGRSSGGTSPPGSSP